MFDFLFHHLIITRNKQRINFRSINFYLSERRELSQKKKKKRFPSRRYIIITSFLMHLRFPNRNILSEYYLLENSAGNESRENASPPL